MSSAHQQLSQLADGGSLPAFMIYLLLCDTIFWVLAVWFCIYVFSMHYVFLFFTSGFLPYFLVGFCSLFISKRIGPSQAVR
jgi:hypothetical protein